VTEAEVTDWDWPREDAGEETVKRRRVRYRKIMVILSGRRWVGLAHARCRQVGWLDPVHV
jgi:hypothetical protein